MILTVVCALFVITGVSWLFFSKNSKADNDTEKQVEGMVQRGDLQCETSTSGTVTDGTDYEYFTVSLPQDALLEVEDVYIQSNAEVVTGDAILKVTDESYQEVKKNLKQQLQEAKTSLSQAKLDYKVDVLTLLSEYTAEKAVSETAYENYENALDVLSLDVEAVQVELNDAKSIIQNNPSKISNVKQKIETANEKIKTYEEKQKTATAEYTKAEKTYQQLQKDYEDAKTELDNIKITKKYIENYTKQQKSNTSEKEAEPLSEEESETIEETDLSRFIASVTQDETALQKQYEQVEKEYLLAKEEYEDKKQKKEDIEEKISNWEEKVLNWKSKKTTYTEELKDAKSTINGLEAKYEKAISAKSIGTIQAEKELAENLLAEEVAGTSYEMQLSDIEDTLQEAQDNYNIANENWKQFGKCFSDGVWMAEKAGTLSYVGYEAGGYMSSDIPVLGYDNKDMVSIELTIDQSEIASIAVGDQVTVNGSFGQGITGTVTNISNTQNSQSVSKVTYAVTVTVENTNQPLAGGDTATVTFKTSSVENTLYIPKRLVQSDEQGNYVLLKNADGTTTRTEIITGASNDMFVEIKEGLSEGDCCVVKVQKEQEVAK